MKQSRALGWVWLVLSPILFVMAAISTVKSEVAYQVQLACFGAVAVAGFIASIAFLLGHPAARRVLQSLSWLGFTYFSGSALLIPVFHVIEGSEVTPTSLAFVTFIAGLIGLTGVPFFVMARRLGNAQPGAPADVARPAGERRG